MLLQPALHRLTAPLQERGDEEEPSAAADERCDDEYRQQEMQRPGRDREDLIRYRREAGDEHRDEAPLLEHLGRGEIALPVAVLLQKWRDRVEREPANRVAGDAADH